jgi:poly[(R)-3-hydroxyalkanoate] polymerase subunit PhaC
MSRPDDAPGLVSGTPEGAAAYTLAANPLVGVRGQDILDAARVLMAQMARNPGVMAQQYLSFLAELGWIASGGSDLAPDAKDKRFADPAWKESAAYRALAQCYLAWGGALTRFVDQAPMDKRDADRARFVISLFVDAMAPTNSLAGNPAALKRLVDTGGASLLHGLENFVGDLVRNRGLPAQVDMSKFAVGQNLATTPGAVVYRSPVMELIQYQPVGPQVHQRPLLIAPPQINKFYVFDLTPDKSIIRFALQGGLQTFAISWKNPTPAEGHFGLDSYVAALEEAIDVMREINGSEAVNVWGSCSGGITMSALLAHLAARGDAKVHCATVAVCVLDMSATEGTTAGIFVTPESIVAAKAASQLAGVVEGQELARMFAWMRPNELIWNYWVTTTCSATRRPRSTCSTGTTIRRDFRRGCMPISSISSAPIRTSIPAGSRCAARPSICAASTWTATWSPALPITSRRGKAAIRPRSSMASGAPSCSPTAVISRA